MTSLRPRTITTNQACDFNDLFEDNEPTPARMALSAFPPIPTPPPMSYDIEEEREHEHQKAEQSKRLWDWLRRLRRDEQTTPNNDSPRPDTPQTPQRPALGPRLSKKVGVGLPRSTTFKRQQEEQRTNLEPVRPSIGGRRQHSTDKIRALSSSPKPTRKKPKRETSAPDLGYHMEAFPTIDSRIQTRDFGGSDIDNQDQLPPPPPPPPPQSPPIGEDDATSEASYESSQTMEEAIRLELQQKWILNLSMHFRDKSPREKFFVTYAETSQRWRRVTVSCDYRDAEVDSLEADLQAMGSQREKSARVYESLRASLGDIQFYATVTNLKLETRDERLHVHVTEDVNEIIAYPPARCIHHLTHVRRFKESDIHFVEHMSGFVYKVNVAGNTWIKKEIPGPDSVDEFLYEVNALSNLTTASHVVELKGLVTSDDEANVKGLLIAYAEKGALVDILYDNRGNLPWAKREVWARHIIKGLSEIHEAGFVQGDFTLSNIVINGNDEAQIIDINRRGCPVGWEPPEIGHLLASGQRISMFIGIKSDLFQLGMVLWALAMEEDEPERQPHPLSLDNGPDEIPGYFRGLVARCLDSDPVMRPSAKDLLREFPASVVVNGSFDQSMPEVKPSRPCLGVPIVKGSSHRAEAQSSEERDAQVQAGVADKVATGPGSKHGSDERIASEGPNYTEMLARTAESMGRRYTQAADRPAGLLQAPAKQETGSSIEAEASSHSADESAVDLSQDAATPPANASFMYPVNPKRPSSNRSRSSSRKRNSNSEYHDARETIQLDTNTDDNSWEAITGHGASPYEVPLSALEAPAETPPNPSTNQRRIYHFNPPSRVLSPPLHVDSGLADVDNETIPRISAEQPRQHAPLATNHDDNPSPVSPTRSVAFRHKAETPNPANSDGVGNGSGNIDSRTSADLSAHREFRHVDSGLADMNLAHVGSNEGLSFKERAHRSGILAPELGEEIARMVSADKARKGEAAVDGGKEGVKEEGKARGDEE